MPYIVDGPSVPVRVSFSTKELSKVEKKADALGLSRAAYIRSMVLEGKAKGYNLKPLQTHAEAVGEVAAAVRDMVALPHPDRWAYEADIERIEAMLQELIESEKKLIEDMTRRLQR